MKAAIYKKYGAPEVVHIADVEKPMAKDDEVLIKIYATTINSADWRARSLEMPNGFGLIGRLIFGVFAPRQPILGTELSGIIESVGIGVTKFKVGDKVFADCGTGFGAHAEYKTMQQDGAIAIKPDNLSFEQAASLCFGGTVALKFLQKLAKIKQGDIVLINGASGTTGTALVQFAKYFGANVTGVCSGANLELVKSIGADKVIDYTKHDFTKNGETYDIIVDTAGTAPWARSENSLNKTGRLVLVLGSLKDMVLSVFVSKKDGKKLIAGVANGSAESLKILADLADQGKFTPVIDRSYPLEKIVDAHKYVDTGRKKGSVVITMDE